MILEEIHHHQPSIYDQPVTQKHEQKKRSKKKRRERNNSHLEVAITTRRKFLQTDHRSQ